MNRTESGIPVPDPTKPFILLELRPDGNVELSTNINMEFTALGLLEMGKKAAAKAFTQSDSGIIAAPASVLQGLNN